jgi:outer membrane protein TolC
LSDTVKVYSDALEVTRDRFEGGAAPEADVAQAQTQLDSTRVQASDIMVQRAQYEHALAILLGRPPAAFRLRATPLNIQAPTLPIIPVAMPVQLLERRPDIAEAERRMAAANEQIGIAKAAYYSTLSVAATAGFEGTSVLNWFNWPSRLGQSSRPFPRRSSMRADAGRRPSPLWLDTTRLLPATGNRF